MAIETWSAGLNGAGVVPASFGGAINYGAKPPGDGWQITGYRTQRRPRVGKAAEGGTHDTIEVPIYSRNSAEAAAAQPPSTENQAPRPEAKLDTQAIAEARAKADAVRRGSMAAPAAPQQDASVYDTITSRGVERQNLFREMIDGFKANAFEQAAETGSALRFGLDSLDPSIKPTKIIDPWEVYERLKGDITG